MQSQFDVASSLSMLHFSIATVCMTFDTHVAPTPKSKGTSFPRHWPVTKRHSTLTLKLAFQTWTCTASQMTRVLPAAVDGSHVIRASQCDEWRGNYVFKVDSFCTSRHLHLSNANVLFSPVLPLPGNTPAAAKLSIRFCAAIFF